MSSRFEAEAPEDIFLGFLDAQVEKFNNLSATGAEQVVMVGVVVGMLVAARPFILAGVAGKPCFREQLQCPEDGRLPYAGIDTPGSVEYVFGAQVPFGPDEGFEDDFARPRHLEVFRAEESFEQHFFFKHRGFSL